MKRGILAKILTKSILKELYVRKFKTANQIAKKLGVKEYHVLYYLKKFSIKKVERWERYGIERFSSEQNEYLYGGLLGDDCLAFSPNGKHPCLQVVHSTRFRDYVEWKYKFWESLVRSGIRKIAVKTRNKIFFAHRFRTAVHPGFLPFYQELYRDRKKQITKRWLTNLTPLSLAIWYMDDGYFRKKRGRIHFITLAFGEKGNKLIRDYFFNKWEVEVNLQKASRGKDKYYLWMNTMNSIKFTKIIAPYILPCFSYKIDTERRLQWRKITPKEREYIKLNYNTQSPRLIAKSLNRPVSGIHHAACRLGLTQQRGGRKVYQFDIKN